MIINDWFPEGDRIMMVGVQGSSKTWLTNWAALCIASGHDFFGHKVKQGRVLIADEETPTHTLNERLNRLAQGLGVKYQELPITVLSWKGYKWGQVNNELYETINKVKPILTSIESFFAYLPAGRKGKSENDGGVASLVKDDLVKMLRNSTSILLTAHTGKGFIRDKKLSMDTLNSSDIPMQDLVSGSPHLVGQACDTGLYIHKIAENPSLMFAIITKPRRSPVGMGGKILYVELQEESYGKGWAKLVGIPPVPPPPTYLAQKLFQYFTKVKIATWKEIGTATHITTKKQLQEALAELLRYHVILEGNAVFTYALNSRYKKECPTDYLRNLRNI